MAGEVNKNFASFDRPTKADSTDCLWMGDCQRVYNWKRMIYRHVECRVISFAAFRVSRLLGARCLRIPFQHVYWIGHSGTCRHLRCELCCLRLLPGCSRRYADCIRRCQYYSV